MRIILNQQKDLNRGEIILSFHPKNKEIIMFIKKLIESRIGEIEVKDEYNNHFLIPLLNIYYFEVVEQKVFVYTKDEVYRLHMTFHELKDFISDKGFLQVNVRTIVNERHVIKYEMLRGCHRKLILDNNEQIISNRQFKEKVDEMIKKRRMTMEDKEECL